MKISIIIPTYNCGEYLEKAILSVLNQSYENKELIVIDAESIDNTKEILEKYSNQLRWISEKDSGQADAINKGFKMASGEIVAWLNADDYYETDIFDDVVGEFKKDKEIVVVYGKCNTVDLDGNLIVKNTPPREITTKKMINKGNFIYQPASFLKKEAVEKVGYLDERLNYWMEYDLFIKLSKIGKLSFIDETLSNFTKREDQKSDRKNKKEMNKELYIISKRYNNKIISKINIKFLINKILEYVTN